ncbi:heme peroxidase [Lentinula lateritia]|uniref:Peroxidase n=1 Tax=Lentinula lateritia TaxID=40482 RepID=A0ABQ8V911_9AGAR|nr:heme peroxidase [Lentinula lateritia]
MLQSLGALYVIITAGLTGLVHSLSTFQWPNPQLAYADKMLYESTLGLLAQGCPPQDNSTVPAQWLRIAYHDMSMHDVDDGTGGLDALIQFELDRPQNIGQGMFDSLNDFRDFVAGAPFLGTADTIALGAIFALAGCGGPVIPFSAGRVDTTEAGPETVPEPQQDLASHTEAFRRQGFTPTEMISLVACGHTLGRVRQVDFPLVVTNTEDFLQTFDTTTNFNNAVVSEYLQNTTQNILVVGPNVTTRLDFRIFLSDGNLHSFLSSDTFNETCGNLIEQMINTVPSGVTLAQPISEPFDYVVSEPLFSYRNGTMSMATTLRIVNPSDNPSRTGHPARPPDVPRHPHTLFKFSSVLSFWFKINENNGSDPVIVDNGGSSFAIGQDSVFIDNSRSEFVIFSSSLINYQKVVMVVHGDASSSMSITTFDPHTNASTPPYLPTIITTNLQLDDSNPAEGGFTFFTVNVSSTVTFLNISGNVGGISYTQENFDMTAVDFTFVSISQ